MTNIKEIKSAQKRLDGFVRKTPILNSPFLAPSIPENN